LCRRKALNPGAGAAEKLRVIHVTTHIGLVAAVARIEPGSVFRTIKRGRETLLRSGIANPRIAVCGINPHAGEGGLFGSGEEEEEKSCQRSPRRTNRVGMRSGLFHQLALLPR
jgi:4-phospho-D-threonate 3-dehydrogenase / 4-phospho-D-erythronate 3-dehydrogenase